MVKMLKSIEAEHFLISQDININLRLTNPESIPI